MTVATYAVTDGSKNIEQSVTSAGTVTLQGNTCTNLNLNPPNGEYITTIQINYGGSGVTYLNFVTSTGSSIAAGPTAKGSGQSVSLSYSQEN